MSPFAIIVRLALSLLCAMAAFALFAYLYVGCRDLGAAIVCALLCTFISWTVAPPDNAVHDLIDQLHRANK